MSTWIDIVGFAVQILAVILAFFLGVLASRLQSRYEKRIEVLNKIRARAYDIYAEIRIIESMKSEETRPAYSEKINDDIGKLLFYCRSERFWLQNDTVYTVDLLVGGFIEVGKQIMGDEGYGSWFSNLMYQSAIETTDEKDFDGLLKSLDDQARDLTAINSSPKLRAFLHIFLNNVPGSKAIRHRLKNP